MSEEEAEERMQASDPKQIVVISGPVEKKSILSFLEWDCTSVVL